LEESVLLKIRKWPSRDPQGWFGFCASVWDGGETLFHRNGSGWEAHIDRRPINEEIVRAMQDNTMLWLFWWQKTDPVGHYFFKSVSTPRRDR